MIDHAPIVIAGGGPVGAALALLLQEAGLSPVVLEARGFSRSAHDTRTLALSWGSRILLEAAGAWREELARDPIRTIHVSQQGGFGRSLIRHEDTGLPALGYIVSHQALVRCLHDALAQAGVAVYSGVRVTHVHAGPAFATVAVETEQGAGLMTTQLAVAAEGGSLAVAGVSIRERAYGQKALVCRVGAQDAPAATAFERFTPHGPVALLPCDGGYACVWTDRPEVIDELMMVPEARFLARLQETLGRRPGRLVSVTERAAWPVNLRRAVGEPGGHRVLIGNAAQALHPVAGQGFNLGLRDARDLARLAETHRQALGSDAMLQAFARMRRRDRGSTVATTDGLVRLFGLEGRPMRTLRGLGLAALELLPPLRHVLAERMIYGVAAEEAPHV